MINCISKYETQCYRLGYEFWLLQAYIFTKIMSKSDKWTYISDMYFAFAKLKFKSRRNTD